MTDSIGQILESLRVQEASKTLRVTLPLIAGLENNSVGFATYDGDSLILRVRESWLVDGFHLDPQLELDADLEDQYTPEWARLQARVNTTSHVPSHVKWFVGFNINYPDGYVLYYEEDFSVRMTFPFKAEDWIDLVNKGTLYLSTIHPGKLVMKVSNLVISNPKTSAWEAPMSDD